MKTIPIRHLTSNQKPESRTGRFSVRDLQQVLNGKDLVHNLHKHDFYFVLAVLEGSGIHEIDFVSYPVHNHSIFILRPGQVHRLELTGACTGFLMEFDLSFHQPKKSITEHLWRKVLSKNVCEVAAGRFTKLYAFLAAILDEDTCKQEGHLEAIKAYMDLFFIEYFRQSRNPSSIVKPESGYLQERFEELVQLLEKNIVSMKNVCQYAGLLNLSTYQLNAITKASV
ncbi:MAG TPA: AraC family ligand binding domain-containing protein, partial [Adhaeribacter sp.]|nr:AraC family ligand binding domain-containing protein [Adhaeribacter sp.]